MTVITPAGIRTDLNDRIKVACWHGDAAAPTRQKFAFRASLIIYPGLEWETPRANLGG